MANVFNCDICQCCTHLYPPYEHEFEKEETEHGDVMKPVMSIMRRQNHFSKEVEEIPVQKIKWLKPRSHIIRLEIAGEEIQRDFCSECVKTILPEAEALWKVLASIGSK